MKTITIRTDSGVEFELLQGRFDPNAWTVIASIGRQSVTAEAIVGMMFLVGDNPFLYARGYAQIVQRGLNEYHDLHQAFGIAAPSPIIREVR